MQNLLNFKNFASIARLILFGLLIAALTAIGPAEKTLGANARVVYLHGVWVWTALACFAAAAISGAVGLAAKSTSTHYWSRALGRTGLFFWITYLPISVWAMQTNWNGLFLAEPRWRLALIFAISSLLLQLGVTLLENPAWASLANILFMFTLIMALQSTENVMHPPAPILNSNAPRIQIYFFVSLILMLLAGWQVARWWRQVEPDQ
jgi:hypothetical protein